MKKILRIKQCKRKLHRKKLKLVVGLIFSILVLFSLNYDTDNSTYIEKKILKTSGIWATLDLMDIYSVNNSQQPHNSLIQIYGRLYNRITDDGKQGYTVTLIIDGMLYPALNNITDTNGYFQIDYYIDPSLDIYVSHTIEAEVTGSTPDNVEYRTYLLIFVCSSSYFDVQDPTTASLHGEFFNFEGYLNYESGMGIPNAVVNYYWYDSSIIVGWGSFLTTGLGAIPYDIIQVPIVSENGLFLKLNFSDYPYVSDSEAIITNTKIFSDIFCIWDIPSNIFENSDLNIAGQLVSNTNPNLNIDNREIQLFYNGTQIGVDTTISTDDNGFFSYTYRLSRGIGVSNLTIVLRGTGLETTRYIDIVAEPTSIPSTPGETPYLMFLTIFLPILGIIIIGLSIYGYHYYKKQDKLSRVVNLPLETKLINLKILKDSGRLEESLSYLYDAIYMDLINAKFGRTRKINETIRDFAIISVKDLKLNPTTTYPFIQKIEEIIYAKPFQITENDFYKTVDLFSPIYLQLTGYNFVLNF